MNDENLLAVVTEIRNWIRAASHGSVKTLLETALPDTESRVAYQMFNGKTSLVEIRTGCKISWKAIVALQTRCLSLGLMELTPENRCRRLFDLDAFGLLGLAEDGHKKGSNK